MLDTRFAEAKPVPTDLAWLAATAVLVVLVPGFFRRAGQAKTDRSYIASLKLSGADHERTL
jgi:hypothetical protein